MDLQLIFQLLSDKLLVIAVLRLNFDLHCLIPSGRTLYNFPAIVPLASVLCVSVFYYLHSFINVNEYMFGKIKIIRPSQPLCGSRMLGASYS